LEEFGDGNLSVRYIVNDVAEAIAFYREQLGFEEVMHPGTDVCDALPRRSSPGTQRAGRRTWWRPGHA